jgi:hypothetical protein
MIMKDTVGLFAFLVLVCICYYSLSHTHFLLKRTLKKVTPVFRQDTIKSRVNLLPAARYPISNLPPIAGGLVSAPHSLISEPVFTENDHP